MTRAKKGDTVGQCRVCGRALKYAGTGRKPDTCPRVKCQRRLAAEKMRRIRKAKRTIDVPKTLA